MKKRIIGILILCIILLPAIYYGGTVFKILATIVGLLAVKELLSLKELKKKLPFFIKLLAYICFGFILYSGFTVDNYSLFMDYRIISLLFVSFLIPLIVYSDLDKYNIMDAMYILGIVLLVGFVFNLLIFIREYDLKRFIYLISISITTDVYAYIAGSLSGREKLCPRLSPKKSIIGLIVGITFGTLIPSMVYYISVSDTVNVGMLLLVTLLLSVISQLGDLIFSSIKRFYNIKDFSNIIFGHGGVLDRFDSLLFVVLGYIFFISII